MRRTDDFRCRVCFRDDWLSRERFQLRSQDENFIFRISLMGLVCGILVTDNAMSAQTERSGADKAGEDCAWRLRPHRPPFHCFLSLSAGNRDFIPAAPAVY